MSVFHEPGLYRTTSKIVELGVRPEGALLGRGGRDLLLLVGEMGGLSLPLLLVYLRISVADNGREDGEPSTPRGELSEPR